MAERIWIGDIGGGTYGIKISKPGINVGSATDDQLLLDTSSNFSRVVQMGQLILPSGGIVTQTASIPSIGGVTPVVLFKYAEVYNGATYIFPLYRNESNTQSTTSNTAFGFTATATSTTVSVTRNYTSSVTNYVYYFILINPI